MCPGTTHEERVKTLSIYDLFGKKIKSFDNSEFSRDSVVRFMWNARDENGNGVPKGTYILICTSPEGRISKKLILM